MKHDTSVAFQAARRRFSSGLALMSAGALWPAARAASEFPSAPVHIVVPSSAGGVNDGMSRALAQWLGKRWNVSFVIDNMPGGNGIIGTRYAARAKPDGYTLLMTPDSILVMNPGLYSNLPYDPVKDFEPISLLFKPVQVLLVNPSVPATNVAELIVYAKANPTKLTYASTGIGTSTHLNTEMIKQMSGIDALHVPYKGGAPALQALVTGDVSMMIIAGNLAEAFVKAGRLRALAVAADKRSALFPGVPTFAESGFEGYKGQPWFGLMAPANTPRPVVDKLNEGIRAALDDKGFRDRYLIKEGLEPIGGTPNEFAQLIRTDTAKWAPIIKASGARIE